MKIKLLFFGATAEIVGTTDREIVVASGASPATVVSELATSHPGLKIHQLLFAVNESYVDARAELNEDDELAIFTAVSGG